MEQMKLQPRTYTKATIKHYVTLLNHVKNFHTFFRQPIPYLEEVDLPYLTRFRMYLTQVVGLKNENNHKKLRTVLNKAYKLDQIPQSPFRLYKFEKNKNHSIVYLTKRELKTIKELEGLSTAVDRVRDIFLFSCYTGLRFSEIQQLRIEHLVERNGHSFLEMQIPKTQKLYLAPLLEEAFGTLIDKYQEFSEIDGRLLPVISNQKSNQTLKFIADLAGISKKLSMHVGRHTFATGALSSGVPLEVVSEWLGHSDIRTTQIYAKITNDFMVENAQLLNRNLYK